MRDQPSSASRKASLPCATGPLSLRISVERIGESVEADSTLSSLLAPRCSAGRAALRAATSRSVVDGVGDGIGIAQLAHDREADALDERLDVLDQPCALPSKHAVNVSWHFASVGASGHRCCARR